MNPQNVQKFQSSEGQVIVRLIIPLFSFGTHSSFSPEK